MFEFRKKENESGRIGILKTKRGVINTPFFMPDATRAFVRSLNITDLKNIEMGPMVVNTYHLYLNPGMETIKKAGSVNDFMNWEKPLLSDSGGYQVFSLIHKNPEMGKVMEDEVIFKSPLDGKKHTITPEKAIEIQFDLGVDMMVVLDDPAPNNYPRKKIEAAVERTIRWAKRCKDEYERQIKKRKIKDENRPLIFGVIQGGGYIDLRKYCAEELVKIGFDGYGFGARHLDSDGNFMEEVVKETAKFIPEESLRFALGVGTPEDVVRLWQFGWDMFDCVIPTREGRHGRLFIFNKQTEFPISNFQFPNKLETKNPKSGINKKSFYETINIGNGRFEDDFSPIDSLCDCELCKNHTRAYLHHLFSHKEPLGMRLASVHNLKFYMELMQELRGN